MKAYLISRVSTEEQKEALPAQTVRLTDYAKRNGYDYELFEIQESAFKGDRQQFHEIVSAIDAHKDKSIVVFDKIDRLTRDPYSTAYIQLVQLFQSGRTELHFPSDNVFLHKDSPAHDKMRLGLGVTFAQYYSAASSDNVKRRFGQMLNDGIWIGAAPFGYHYTLQDGRKWLAPDPIKADIVRFTFKAYATGTSSLHAIAKDWNNKFGLKARHCKIERILKNPFYYGEMRVKDKLYSHSYEPLIPKNLYDKVQDVLHGYSAKPHRWAGLPFPYRGLITCLDCGCKVTFEIKKGKYIYGHCTQHKYKHGASYINENKLTEQFKDIIGAISIPDRELIEAQEVIKEELLNNEQHINQKRQALEREINKYSVRLDNMYNDRLDGLISPELYEQKFKEFTKSKEHLENDLQNIELLDNNKLNNFSYLLELSNKAPELFLKANYKEKRELIKILLSNLQLDGKLLRWEYQKPFDLMALCNKNANWCGWRESNSHL